MTTCSYWPSRQKGQDEPTTDPTVFNNCLNKNKIRGEQFNVNLLVNGSLLSDTE